MGSLWLAVTANCSVHMVYLSLRWFCWTHSGGSGFLPRAAAKLMDSRSSNSNDFRIHTWMAFFDRACFAFGRHSICFESVLCVVTLI